MSTAPDTGRTADCAHCRRPLTAEEQEYYGTSCERCETELHHAMQDDRAPVLPPPASEVERLRAEAAHLRARLQEAEKENDRLRIAFHDAIRRPLGVTPDSGAEFYVPRMADEAEERRSSRQRAAWPSGCIKPNSCSRHRQCMYAGSVEQCRHFGKDLTQAVEDALREREWAAAALKEREG